MTRNNWTLAVVTLAAAVSFGAASSAGAREDLAGHQDAAVPEAPRADRMIDAWQSFAGKLPPEAMQRIGFAFDGDERVDWAYVPRQRVGLPIGELADDASKQLADLLETGLGDDGRKLALAVIELEEVLFVRAQRAARRDPGLYFLATFGIPSTEGAWGWRFEGHHLSVNFTIINDRIVSATPAFFGGSPAVVPDDSDTHPGLSPFAAAQNLGRRLVETFAPERLAEVIISETAPADVVTGNAPRADMGPPEGVAHADMSEEQQAMLLELIGVYADRFHSALAAYQLTKIREAGIERVHFAWAGGTKPGEPHYYRIQGPTFVVEWDNTQDDANHVHSVWRDFDDDFGYEPLRQHLAAQHGLEVTGARGNVTGTLGSGDEIVDDERQHQRAHARGMPHGHR